MELALNNWGRALQGVAFLLINATLALTLLGALSTASALLVFFSLDALLLFGSLATQRREGKALSPLVMLSFYGCLAIVLSITVNMIA